MSSNWKPVTPEHAVRVLNRAVEEDQDAVTALVGTRLPCNGELAADATIQVGRSAASAERPATYEVGFLGVLNGIFGVDEHGWGAIVAHLDEWKVTHFSVREMGSDPKEAGRPIGEKIPTQCAVTEKGERPKPEGWKDAEPAGDDDERRAAGSTPGWIGCSGSPR